MFITTKYTRSTKPNDAMYAWLENISSKGFELCIREFLPFDGKHQDTTVVSSGEPKIAKYHIMRCKVSEYFVLPF